jgi:hypothetical protein
MEREIATAMKKVEIRRSPWQQFPGFDAFQPRSKSDENLMSQGALGNLNPLFYY